MLCAFGDQFGPPYCQHEKESLHSSRGGEMLHQRVGKLCDCENEDEVEEQLDKGYLTVSLAAAGPEEAPCRPWRWVEMGSLMTYGSLL